MVRERFRTLRRAAAAVVTAASALIVVRAEAQQTVGLFLHTAGSLDSGYVFFAPASNTVTYLIDKCGQRVHTWPSTFTPVASTYLLNDGSILRSGYRRPNGPVKGSGGTAKIDWDGNITWGYELSDSSLLQHHDMEPLPNGNVLIIYYELHSIRDAYAAGRDTSQLGSVFRSEALLELHPIGTDSAEIVWKWSAWDHLIQDYNAAAPNHGTVSAHPELIDLNFPHDASARQDWLHFNSVRYNAALDQVLVSCHNFDEVWIIDHHTTTAEAASHAGGGHGRGGDLLYRWGNPAAYNQGTAADQKFFGQHDAHWIPTGLAHGGEIMVFNNGLGRPGGGYTSVDIIAPPVDNTGSYDASTIPYLPAALDWTYTSTPQSDFYANTIGGAQTLVNGNTLVCDGPAGRFFEIDSAGNGEVWEYVNPVCDTGPIAQGMTSRLTTVFKCAFFAYSFPGFAGHVLAAGSPLELNPSNYTCRLNVDSTRSGIDGAARAEMENTVFAYPNPASDHIAIATPGAIDRVSLYNCLGVKILDASDSHVLNTAAVAGGIYYVVVRRNGTLMRTMVSVLK